MHLKSKRILSVFLCFSMVVVGVLSNLSTAYATFVPQKVRVDFFADYLRARHGTSADAFITFFNQNIDTGVWVVFWDSDNEKLAIVQYGNTLTFNSVWYNGNGNDLFRLGDWTGSVYRPNAFCFSTKLNNGTYYFRTQTNFYGDYTPTDYIVFPESYSSRVYFCPGTRDTFNQEGIFSFINHDVQLGKDGITFFRRNLFGSLVALYQNVVFYRNDHLYFTFSDQDVFFDVFVGTADAELQLTVEGSFMGESGEIETGTGTFLYSESDFVRFPDIIIFDGVTNISPNGLRAIDITALSNYSKLLSSRVYPDGYYEMGYFADNEIVISNIISTPTDPYEALGDALADLDNRLTILENAPVPDYELQGYITFPDASINGSSYPDLTSELYQFSVDLAGIARLHNRSNLDVESLDIAPRSVLVVRSNEYGLSAITGKLLTSSDISTLWSQVDVVIVLSNSDYDTIVSDSAFDPVYISIFQDSGLTYRSSWFLADWENMVGFPTSYTYFYGPGFFTEHYLMCVNNYILSDGFSMIADGLTKLGEVNKDGFQAVASSVGSVYAAVQLTNSNWASFLRDFGSFKDTLFNKLDLIIDKLDTIVNNTDERMHDFWIRPVYDFLFQFTPSLTGFGNWIDEIETEVESLPEIPVITVPALPTLPVIEGS